MIILTNLNNEPSHGAFLFDDRMHYDIKKSLTILKNLNC